MRKLPVGEAIAAAFRGVWENKGALLRNLFPVLFLASLAQHLSFLASPLFGKNVLAMIFARTVFDYALMSYVTSLVGVTSIRVLLLGEPSVPRFGQFLWTRREWRFFGWTIYVSWFPVLVNFFAIFLSFYGMFYVVGTANASSWARTLGPGMLLAGPFLIGLSCFIGIYLAIRYSVLFVTSATNMRGDRNWARRITNGNWWRLFGVGIPTGIAICAVSFIFSKINYFFNKFSFFLPMPYAASIAVSSAMEAVFGVFIVSLALAPLVASFRFLTASPEEEPCAADAGAVNVLGEQSA